MPPPSGRPVKVGAFLGALYGEGGRILHVPEKSGDIPLRRDGINGSGLGDSIFPSYAKIKTHAAGPVRGQLPKMTAAKYELIPKRQIAETWGIIAFKAPEHLVERCIIGCC